MGSESPRAFRRPEDGLPVGAFVIERYVYTTPSGKNGVQWLAQVVDKDGDLALMQVCKRVERQRRSSPVPDGHGTTLSGAPLGWHVISGEHLLEVLHRANQGEDADILFAELWANADHERDDPDA